MVDSPRQLQVSTELSRHLNLFTSKQGSTVTVYDMIVSTGTVYDDFVSPVVMYNGIVSIVEFTTEEGSTDTAYDGMVSTYQVTIYDGDLDSNSLRTRIDSSTLR